MLQFTTWCPTPLIHKQPAVQMSGTLTLAGTHCHTCSYFSCDYFIASAVASHDEVLRIVSGAICVQTFLCSEKLGLYGKNTVGNSDYYIAAGDSGHITVGGTIGGMVIAGQPHFAAQQQESSSSAC